MKEWFRIAFSASVRRRALRVAGVVGSVLIAINHGDAVLKGDLSPERLIRMALTLIVPYLVSTFSSVGAIRELRRARVSAEAAEAVSIEATEAWTGWPAER
jgi:hypothetical protein